MVDEVETEYRHAAGRSSCFWLSHPYEHTDPTTSHRPHHDGRAPEVEMWHIALRNQAPLESHGLCDSTQLPDGHEQFDVLEQYPEVQESFSKGREQPVCLSTNQWSPLRISKGEQR